MSSPPAHIAEDTQRRYRRLRKLLQFGRGELELRKHKGVHPLGVGRASSFPRARAEGNEQGHTASGRTRANDRCGQAPLRQPPKRKGCRFVSATISPRGIRRSPDMRNETRGRELARQASQVTVERRQQVTRYVNGSSTPLERGSHATRRTLPDSEMTTSSAGLSIGEQANYRSRTRRAPARWARPDTQVHGTRRDRTAENPNLTRGLDPARP